MGVELRLSIGALVIRTKVLGYIILEVSKGFELQVSRGSLAWGISYHRWVRVPTSTVGLTRAGKRVEAEFVVAQHGGLDHWNGASTGL